MRTLFDHVSRDGADGVFPVCDVPSRRAGDVLGAGLVRARAPRIPNLSEGDVARHYTRLSKLNYGVDDGIYPLGSCTMKYNQK
jgi:glycine dehydrogenase subunit 2